MDRITSGSRSRNMSRIKSKNTKPEIKLRRLLYSLGFRYRIHYNLPGKPDVVFIKKKIAIFVNGCFWHGHEGCKESHIPKTHSKFWENKILKNKDRDIKNIGNLKKGGWSALTFWECDLEKDANGEITIKMRGDGELKTGLDNIKKCIKKQDCNPFGGNDNSNNSTIKPKNSNSISEVRAFESACSAGRARTCDPAVNSRMLYH